MGHITKTTMEISDTNGLSDGDDDAVSIGVDPLSRHNLELSAVVLFDPRFCLSSRQHVVSQVR
jgi:hypothetical protein